MSKLDEIKHELRNCESGRDVYDVANDAIKELERALLVVEAARQRGGYVYPEGGCD